MHPFHYVAAKSVDEAVSVLSEHGDRARCLAGGTDVLVQARAGRFDLDALIDVKGIPELSSLELGAEGLSMGAAVPCYQLYENPGIMAAYPAITDAASLIGGIQIQSRATLGGNLCNATPSADGICPLIVHSARAKIAGPNGRRTVAVEEFCIGPGRTTLSKGELLVSVEIPAPGPSFGAAYQRFIPRNEMDIAIVGVASSLEVNSTTGSIEVSRIALAAVGPTPIIAIAAGDSLTGKMPSSEAFEEAADLAANAASPINDMRGDIEFRRTLVRVLTQRTLNTALERTRSGS